MSSLGEVQNSTTFSRSTSSSGLAKSSSPCFFFSASLCGIRDIGETSDSFHASGQAELPTSDVATRGLAHVRVDHHDFDHPQHSRPDVEGWWAKHN